MSLGEKIFLFCWALISNTKDILVDYALDFIENLIASERSKKRKQRRLRKRQYFKRFMRQIGYDKDLITKARSQKIENAPSKPTIEPNDAESKLEALENELMSLKEELSQFANKAKVEPVMKDKVAPVIVTPQIEVDNIPPPPPLPISKPIKPKQNTETKIPATPVKKFETPQKPVMSIADMIKNSKGRAGLRKVQNRSPRGTPVKRNNDKMCFQNELFAAIKNKFKSMEASPDPKSNLNDSFSSCSDSDFTPPRINSKHIVSPAKNKETGVNHNAENAVDKENKTVSQLTQFFNKQTKTQSPRRPRNVSTPLAPLNIAV